VSLGLPNRGGSVFIKRDIQCARGIHDLNYRIAAKRREGTGKVLRFDCESASRLIAVVFAAVPIFSLVLLLSADVAYATPLSQSASLPPLAKIQVQDCENHARTSFSPPLLIPAHLAFYAPASLTACANDAPSLVIGTSRNPSQEPPGSKNVHGQPKSPCFEHPFWDRENGLLFAAVGASRTLDYFSTLNFRRRGRNEALLTNDVVDNHAAFASIEAAATVASIGLSYVFHRYHHHRLERWTSIVHASLATSGAVRNYCLKTAHP
jgi:hypothetical protein